MLLKAYRKILDKIKRVYNTVSLKLSMWVCILLKAANGATTYHSINNGLAYELNPIANWMFENGDLLLSLLIFFNIFVAIVYHLYTGQKRRALLFVTLLMTSVVLNNLFMIGRALWL